MPDRESNPIKSNAARLNMKRTRFDALHQCFDCSEFLR